MFTIGMCIFLTQRQNCIVTNGFLIIPLHCSRVFPFVISGKKIQTSAIRNYKLEIALRHFKCYRNMHTFTYTEVSVTVTQRKQITLFVNLYYFNQQTWEHQYNQLYSPLPALDTLEHYSITVQLTPPPSHKSQLDALPPEYLVEGSLECGVGAAQPAHHVASPLEVLAHPLL